MSDPIDYEPLLRQLIARKSEITKITQERIGDEIELLDGSICAGSPTIIITITIEPK